MNIPTHGPYLNKNPRAYPCLSPFVRQDIGDDRLENQSRREHGIDLCGLRMLAENGIMLMEGLIAGNIQGLPPIDNMKANICDFHSNFNLIPFVIGIHGYGKTEH